jgi:transcriptional regulator with AAA-type ATPase domain
VEPLAELIGESPGITAVREQIQRLLRHQSGARRAPPILIIGETGTGKGLVARIIHRAGPRANQPFVDVNCAAIPETLLEAELFGFERGAFTDARQAKPGLFQAAHRGTIFLDEVGLLSEALQAKLLTVIEERAVRRLGSTRSEPTDVMIVAATNEDLEVATREQRFRVDLYHRLAVLALALPALRERGDDVLLLAERLLSRVCADYGLSSRAFSADAVTALRAYHWPGNIRELKNVVERAVLLSETAVLTADTIGLPVPAAAAPERPAAGQLPERAAGGADRDRVLAVLEEAGWNVSRAAALLGVTRNTIRYRMEKLGVRQASATPAAPSSRSARVESPPVPLAAAAPVAAPPAAVEASSLRWERRRVTLLRAEARPRSPAEAPAELARAIETFVEKAQAFGGRVEEIGSTMVLTAFGLEPLEDAPRRAASAALAMEKALERQAGSHREPGVTVRIGVHVATAKVGRVRGLAAIDDQAKREAVAVLDALLARLEGGGVAVSDSAAPFLERRFDLLPLDPGSPGAWRLAGPERAAASPAARQVRFVGRGQELDLLQSRFALAGKGDGQVVGVVGEAGIGKSRLVHQFRQRVADQGAMYLEGQCLPHATSVPYTPVIEILRAHCGIVDSDGPRAIAEKVHRALLDAGMEPAENAGALLDLLGTPAESERAPGPEASKERLFETLRQVIVRTSARRPLVIVVEDLHWVDRTSEEYLTSLIETVTRARILVVGTYRPGYRPPWLGKSYATQVALQPLTAGESLSVVRGLLAGDRVADPLIQLILTRGGGNPFFLEELARAAREHGGGLAVPDTVEELLLARLDRLPPDDKRLLQCAATIGRDVPFSLVAAVAGTAPDATLGALGRLRGSEFILETNLIPEPTYAFKHALTQEVAYRALSEDEGRDLHGRVVDAIEDLHRERLGDHVESLAHHARYGERWEAAVRYLRQSAARAAARWAHLESATCLEQALAALSHLPETRTALELAVDLRAAVEEIRRRVR